MKIYRNAPKIVEKRPRYKFIHYAPKTLSTALEMAKNQGLDSVCQNKKIKIKNFERRQRSDVLAYRGDTPTNHGGPFSAFWSATNTDLFVTYAARLADGPTDHHQRPPTGQPLATTGDDWRHGKHWRPLAERLTDGRHWRQGWPLYQ